MFISFFCLFITVFLYIVFRKYYQKNPHFWNMPVLAVSCGLILFLQLTPISYDDYIFYNQWLIWFLGPVMVSFAVPLYRHRQMIKDHKLSLCIGVIVGVVMAVFSALFLARLFHLPLEMQKSLIVRSISTPFAMNVAHTIGGSPSQAAVFVVFAGLFGHLSGLIWIAVFNIRSHMAKGAMLGAASHGIGAAKAFEISGEAGVVASLVMMISGMLTMLLAPLIGLLFP